MRNLKKFLALVLAMMMTLSLMVTVNAKNVEFDDGESVNEAFIEDLTVLAGMGVIQGMDDGNFAPTSTVTRAQMAAIVYRLRTGDASADPEYKDKSNMYAGYGDFKDVKDTSWYAGYVGYCANAGIIIGDGDGNFRPNSPVTGNEALVMLLRAMGYNQPNEFTGKEWRQHAASIATSRGLLDKVNTTVYRGTLMNGAAREVIAEITFQAATKAQVVYTAAFGYQTTGMSGGVTGTTQNPTLGYQYYGLTNQTGIVVGNQETGESNTRVSFPVDYAATGYVYAYGPVSMDNTGAFAAVDVDNDQPAVNTIGTFAGETGLDLFGHAVELWYDAKSSGAKTTYATFDRATKTAIVQATNVTIVNPATDGSIGKAAAGAGFSGIDAQNKAAVNTAFGRFLAAPTATVTASPVQLYALISNAGTDLDVVIELNIETTEITAVDNVNAIKTVSFPIITPATTPAFVATSQVTTGVASIEQAAVMPNSSTTLRDKVIGYHVAGTNGSYDASTAPATQTAAGYTNKTNTWDETAYFKLQKVNEPIQAVVMAYNETTGKLVLNDNRTLDKSILYGTVVTGTIPQQTNYNYGTYNIWLDDDGDFLGAAPVTTTNFIYGTYMDYQTATSSSAFEYLLTGVNLAGEKVTIPVTSLDGTAVNSTDVLGVPFRDTYGTGGTTMNGVGAGEYIAFTYNDKALNTSLTVAGATVGNDGTNDLFAVPVATVDGKTTTAGQIFMGSTAKTLGAVLAGKNAAGAAADNLYFTENTQFYLVSGYGTADLDVKAFKGISGLMNGASGVTIDFNDTTGVSATTNMPYITAGTEFDEMTYFTQSPFTYSQTGARGYQADVVILPAAAVKWSGSSSMFYVGDNTYTLINADDNASQFTMYVNGERASYWLDGLAVDITVGGSTVSANGSAETVQTGSPDQFYNLIDTGKKANDGKPIYTLDGAAIAPSAGAADGVITVSQYVSATYASQTATFIQDTTVLTTPMRNVSNAKVINVNKDNSTVTWPGITDLATLNAAGSLEQYVGNDEVKVTAILNSENPLVVDYIYVCFDQT